MRSTSWVRGRILSTSPVRCVIKMFDPTASITSMESVLRSSQGRAMKAYGFEVRAPTGQRSITLPLSSERNIFSTYVPTYEIRVSISAFIITAAYAIYLHIATTTSGAKIVDASYFRGETDATRAVDATSHNCLDERSDVLVFHSPRKARMCKTENIKR